MIQIFKFISLLLFQQLYSQASDSIKYCKSQQVSSKNCLECRDGYEQYTIDSDSQQSQIICRAQCPQNYFRQSINKDNSFTCNSICSISQIGNQDTRTCEEVYKCPNSSEFGQSFHKGKVDNLIFYAKNQNDGVQEIITSSSSDERIFVWDSQTGQQIAQLKGHSSFVLKIILMDKQTNDDKVYLFSYAQDGEVIIWNYLKAEVNYRCQIINGQLQSQSKIDFQRKLIISYGFQGEFFVVNYESLKFTTYFHHTNIVDSVEFFENNKLISTSKDKQILLWDMNKPDKPIIITQMILTKMLIIPFSMTVNNKSNIVHLLFGIGKEIDNNKKCSKVYMLTDQNTNAIEQNFISIQQTFTDHQNDIINLIIDNTNFRMITYSQSEIIIYKSVNSSKSIVFSLYQKVDLSKFLPSSETLISVCQLFSDKFIISTSVGQLILLKYNIILDPNTNSLLSVEENNLIVIERQKRLTDAFIQLIYLKYDDILYAFSNQVIAIKYQTRNIKFIINNWPDPQFAHTAEVFSLAMTRSTSLIATVSKDGRAFIADSITLEMLNIIEHPKNINKSPNTPLILPTFIEIVFEVNICISYTDKSFICYHPLTSKINFKPQEGNEQILKIKRDSSRSYVFACGKNYGVIYDLQEFKTIKEYQKEDTDTFFDYIFEGHLDILYGTSSVGYITKFNYPDFTVNKTLDLAYLNYDKQKVKGYKIDLENNNSLIYFDNGLIILLTSDLEKVVSTIRYKAPLSSVSLEQFYDMSKQLNIKDKHQRNT